MSTFLERDGLVARWRRINPNMESGLRDPCELDARGDAVLYSHPSARRQIVLTDAYCQITEQIGHVAAMAVPVTTTSFGIRIPDVIWMPPDNWERIDRSAPVPFVPALCVEVLLDRDTRDDIDLRVGAYLKGGAREVIVVDEHGRVEFWGANGLQSASKFGITLSLEQMYFDEPAWSSIPNAHC
ncbi:hypothetical protein PPGU19_097510 (plasmid) [Paraburkholderia sp. PGU19]|uniref:Uma2 family endonuclease n=1 Tax=Paraburkholderia sp. PGU19 TaxID=2735434 RepID=UPI0015DD1B5F|nr:Uma2 family endonuclease [Paraburkholderia sp. PGU19]BCG05183.1 hypothetical protein PPGU19_097510 [Paraburkholderia sp. PGU19]